MKNQAIVNMVMILNKPTRQYFIINPATGKQQLISCPIVGDITENRANEMITEKYDPKAKIKGNKLHFNNKKLTIISTAVIKKDILELIEEKGLATGDTSAIKILSKADLRKIVLAETKEGGKFDFFTEIKGHEMDGIQIKPGVYSTRISVALYKWGKANFELGTNTVEDALEFWAELKGRQANQREKDYIKMGFNKELEK